MTKSAGEAVADALGVILQRNFRSGIYRHLTTGLDDALDPATYPVLSGVGRYGASSAATLGQRIGLDRSIVSRRAARLVEAGLLEAEPDPADARASLLTLTRAGEEVVRELRRRLAAVIDRQLADWDDAERTGFATLLERFAASGPLTP